MTTRHSSERTVLIVVAAIEAFVIVWLSLSLTRFDENNTNLRTYHQPATKYEPLIDLPLYYINLVKSDERRRYMENAFGGRDARNVSLHRVEAVTSDASTLAHVLGDSVLPDKNELFKDPLVYIYGHTKALPGQVANTVSHLTAIKRAYEAGHEAALICEDDISDFLVPHWPFPLSHLMNLVESEYPNWGVIRLQWNDYEGVKRSIKADWLATRAKKTALVREHPSGWGNAASIFHRRAMSEMLKRYSSSAQSGRWVCSTEKSCAADLMFWTELSNSKVLIATPPWLPYRLAEGYTGIREGQFHYDHTLLHMTSTAEAVKWWMEWAELQSSGGDQLNTSYVWNVTQPE